jgi:hypothetical protein
MNSLISMDIHLAWPASVGQVRRKFAPKLIPVYVHVDGSGLLERCDEGLELVRPTA